MKWCCGKHVYLLFTTRPCTDRQTDIQMGIAKKPMKYIKLGSKYRLWIVNNAILKHPKEERHGWVLEQILDDKQRTNTNIVGWNGT